VGFEQAVIKVQNEAEFEELKSALERVFQPERTEKFLKLVRKGGARVWDVEKVLDAGCLERADEVLARSGKTGKGLYAGLSVSDQAQMREFYLSRVEQVKPELRTRFQKLYQYY
jgi:hypothetical protein